MTRRRPGPSRSPAGRSGARPGALRVVAGALGGRRIDAPVGARPTSDRVREAVFNALESLGALEGAEVLDAFAGSGALGIEALSRGAAAVTFVERDPRARRVLEDNLATLDLVGSATVRAGSALDVLTAGAWDLVLLDPPYADEGWPDLLAATAGATRVGGVVVVESDRTIPHPRSLTSLRSRRYGGTVVEFSTPTRA